MRVCRLNSYPTTLTLALLIALPSTAMAFDTLLTSPAQRALLDKQRNKQGVVPSEVIKIAPSTEPTSLEGLVTREHGPASIWLNGRLMNKPPGSQSLQSRHGSQSLEVKLQSGLGSVWVKAGQRVNPESGVLSDAYLDVGNNSVVEPNATIHSAIQTHTRKTD
ncbi:MAG: hypothetical protein AB9Q18_02430 [Candidatus Reddybacter sp.]